MASEEDAGSSGENRDEGHLRNECSRNLVIIGALFRVENHGLENLGVASGGRHRSRQRSAGSRRHRQQCRDGRREDSGVVKNANERHTKAYSLKLQRSCGFRIFRDGWGLMQMIGVYILTNFR